MMFVQNVVKGVAIIAAVTLSGLWIARQKKRKQEHDSWRRKLAFLVGGGLDRVELKRYSRQVLVPQVGPEGQRRLCDASVLVVGAGGLGCSIIPQLAGAGVGRLGILDGDVIEISNLHRQVLYSESLVGVNKAIAARQYVQRLNTSIQCEAHPFFLTCENAEALVRKYDLIIEATDSLAAKYIVSDACSLVGKAFVSGGAQGLEGQLALYSPGKACYRCMFPEPPPASERSSCADDGVLGPIPLLIGSFQALLATHYLVQPESGELGNSFFVFDGSPTMTMLKMEFSSSSRKQCDRCGTNPRIKTLEDTQRFCEEHELLTSSCAMVSLPGFVQSCSWDFVQACDEPFLVVDVRRSLQHRIWSLQDAFHLPLSVLKGPQARANIDRLIAKAKHQNASVVFVHCRRGIDSVEATGILVKDPAFTNAGLRLFNVQGGLQALANLYPTIFPSY